jgi:hypothetical protein
MLGALRRSCLIVAIAVATTVIGAACQSPSDRPSAPVNLGDIALAHPRFAWDSIPSEAFTLYVPRGSYAAERASQYRDELEAALAHALAMLGEVRYPAHLRVFVLASREDVESVTGTGWNGWADPAGKSVGVVARAECRPVFRHEIMHAVSLLLWGNPLGPAGDPLPPKDANVFARGGWLREGIAAAAEDLYLRYSYRGMAAQWQAEGALLSLDTLVHAFYQSDDLAAYLQAGSLVQYLLERYGNQRLRLVWREGPSGFQRAYGRSPSQLEAEWHDWLRATPASARPRTIAVARSEDRCPPRRRQASSNGRRGVG